MCSILMSFVTTNTKKKTISTSILNVWLVLTSWMLTKKYVHNGLINTDLASARENNVKQKKNKSKMNHRQIPCNRMCQYLFRMRLFVAINICIPYSPFECNYVNMFQVVWRVSSNKMGDQKWGQCIYLLSTPEFSHFYGKRHRLMAMLVISRTPRRSQSCI